MSDLIKREDAIEAVASADETDGTVKVFTGRQVNDILSALPPANYATEKTNDATKPSNDVINREDAIEIIDKMICDNKWVCECAINSLPSPQPQGELVSKENAKEAVACELHYKLGMDIEMAKGVASVIDALPTPYREDSEA